MRYFRRRHDAAGVLRRFSPTAPPPFSFDYIDTIAFRLPPLRCLHYAITPDIDYYFQIDSLAFSHLFRQRPAFAS